MRVLRGGWSPHIKHAFQPAATSSSNRSYEDLMESLFSQTLEDLRHDVIQCGMLGSITSVDYMFATSL